MCIYRTGFGLLACVCRGIVFEGTKGGTLGEWAVQPGHRGNTQQVYNIQRHCAVRQMYFISCAVRQVSSADDLVISPEGPIPLPGPGGTGLGASRLETVVRLAVVPPPLGPPSSGPRPSSIFTGPYLNPALLYGGSSGGGGRGGGGMSSCAFLAVSIGSLELSLVDGRPEEIAVITVDELAAEVTTGRAAGATFGCAPDIFVLNCLDKDTQYVISWKLLAHLSVAASCPQSTEGAVPGLTTPMPFPPSPLTSSHRLGIVEC